MTAHYSELASVEGVLCKVSPAQYVQVDRRISSGPWEVCLAERAEPLGSSSREALPDRPMIGSATAVPRLSRSATVTAAASCAASPARRTCASGVLPRATAPFRRAEFRPTRHEVAGVAGLL
jgi:hypothetical protein